MKTTAFAVLFLAILCPLWASWPNPRLDYYHAATEAQGRAFAAKEARLLGWAITTPDCKAGSMLPYIVRGNLVLLEPYQGQPLKAGDVVAFTRHDGKSGVLHMVADANSRAVYMTGTGNRRSDGWQSLASIRYIARRVVTFPSAGSVGRVR